MTKTEEGAAMKLWECKIGEIDAEMLSMGADSPLRSAVEKAYIELTGREPDFCFSGWDGKLSEAERDVVNGPPQR